MPVPGCWDDAYALKQARILWPEARFNPDHQPLKLPVTQSLPDASLPYLVGTGWYRKEVTLPESWRGQQVILHLGRCTMEARVYLNGKGPVHLAGHAIARRVPLNDPVASREFGEEALRFGVTNEILIAVDNRRADRLGCDIRGWKGRSGGIFGPVYLDAAGPVRFAGPLYVREEEGGTLRWQASLAGSSLKDLEIRWRIRSRFGERILGEGRHPLMRGEHEPEWITEAIDLPRWSDRHPELVQVEAEILDVGEILHRQSQPFGLRRLSCEVRRILLNEKPIYLRGVCDCAYFPETCTIPLEKTWYLNHIARLKEAGFNWIRFHTWIPSEPYMRAADELGMLLQVEPPKGYGLDEWRGILRACRHHPSVIIYCCGNEECLDEARIEYLRQCKAELTRLAPDALFNPQEALRGIEYGWSKADMGEDSVLKPYHHNPGRLEQIKEFSDVLGHYSWGLLSYASLRGEAKFIEERLVPYALPCLTHETGICGSYPDLNLAERYQGTRIGPVLYDEARKALDAAGLLDRASHYYKNSCAWQRLMVKDALEMTRRCPSITGYDLLGANDNHWHRSGYGCGLLNEFDEWKPGGSPRDALRFNGESVLLVSDRRVRNLLAGSAFEREIHLSWFGEDALESGRFTWRLVTDDAHELGRGRVDLGRENANGADVIEVGTAKKTAGRAASGTATTGAIRIAPGTVTLVHTLRCALPTPARPLGARLEVRLDHAKGFIENSWDYVLFPPVSVREAPKNIEILSELDRAAVERLIEGGRAILFGSKPLPSRGVSFQMGLAGRPGGNLATVIADHPLTDRLPHDGYCAWPFHPLLAGARAVLFDAMPEAFDPIIEIAGSYKQPRRQAVLFEWRVGKGKLLVCTLSLKDDDPAGAWFRRALLDYATSDAFEPRVGVDRDLLRRILKMDVDDPAEGEETDKGFDPRAQLPEGKKKVGRMDVDEASYVARHNLVYRRPAKAWLDGLPMGNGDLGALKFGPPGRIEFGLCKGDLWDRRWGPDPDPVPTNAEVVKSLENNDRRGRTAREMSRAGASRNAINEALKKIDDEPGSFRSVRNRWMAMVGTVRGVCTPKAAGRLILESDGLAVREPYEEVLDLPTGVIRQRAATNRGDQQLRCLVDAEGDTLSVRLSGAAARALSRITLYRAPDRTRGPKNFPVQWEDLPPVPGTDGEIIWIRQDFPWGGSYDERFHVVMAARVEGAKVRAGTDDDGSHLVIDEPPAGPVTVHLTLVSTRDVAGVDYRARDPSGTYRHSDEGTEKDHTPLDMAKIRLARATSLGYTVLETRSGAWWKRFWAQSLVSLPDARIEQAWYLLFHQLGCSSRAGRQAPGLCGLWVPGYATPWGGDYHMDQNTQMMFWGCFTNNHLELVKPYFDLLRQWVSRARWRAREVYQAKGIRWPLASGPEGHERCPPEYAYEHWNQGAAASHFWFYYQYTMDRHWLKSVGYPILKESLRFYETYMTVDDRGRRVIFPSIPPETRTWAVNPVADLAVIRLLIEACIEASMVLDVDAEARTRWKAMKRELAPYPLTGEPGAETFAFSESHAHLHAVHASTVAPVFPGNDVGLDSPPELLARGIRTLKSLMDVKDETGKVVKAPLSRITHGRGWLAIAAARLGLGRETGELLEDWVSTFFQHNGLTQAWDSRFIRMEPIATDAHTVTTAMGEMLLQSYSGRIRLFPAVPPDWKDARFVNLRAVGGFLVSAERRNGATAYARIESLAGEPCVVIHPWPGEAARILDEAGAILASGMEGSLSFPTREGGVYRLERSAAPMDGLPEVRITGYPAMGPRGIAKGKYFGLHEKPAGTPFAGSSVGEMVHVEAINDGVIRETKKWPGPVQLPADSICRVEPLHHDASFTAHFGVAYDETRYVRGITAWAGSGYCSVYGTARLSWVPRAYVIQYWTDGAWKDVPGTRVRDNVAFPIEHRFDPVRTAKIRLLITETGTGRFVRNRGEPARDYHNAAMMELQVLEAPPPKVREEKFSYASTLDGTAPLHALIAYPEGPAKPLPLIVCMHGFSETAGRYIKQNRHLAEEGWFVACVEMRGRGGSAGKHDSGGIEIHDIYDAVEALKKAFPDRIDAERVGIQGWSGGGGNVLSCMTKLPDTFGMGASFFGIADYGRWQEILDGINPRYPGPAKRIGVTKAEAPDRYLARNSSLAAANNSYSRIFLFNDEQEKTCLPDMDRAYMGSADAAGLSNVTFILSKPGDEDRYMHGGRWDSARTNAMILTPLMAGEFPRPRIAPAGTFDVLGFLVTRDFALYCGDGQEGAARVEYRLDGNMWRFTSRAMSRDGALPLTVRLPRDRVRAVKRATVDGKTMKPVEKAGGLEIVAPGLNAEIHIVIENGNSPSRSG